MLFEQIFLLNLFAVEENVDFCKHIICISHVVLAIL